MVNEPVKTIIDHGQKTNLTIMDHELTMTNRQWLTMVNHGQLVMVTSWSMMAWTVVDQDTTMTMVSIGQLLNNQLKIKNLQSDISSYYNEGLFEIRVKTL